ncbi:MAG: deoxyribonuclease IV [Verrucomicrobia bacterium]|nr:deoxyribonuclease IV [Verrucomicrobiota bacterium]MDE3048148.1 deoxyribonuclease IV [Verrucomicrobiota bacterium]
MKKKILIGAHTSAAGGPHRALYQGQEIGATTIQLFTSNQKQWQGSKIGAEEIALWDKALAETGITEVMSHDSYLINLGAPDLEILTKSRKAFREEIERCHALKIAYLNFHPGAYTTSSLEECLETIVQSLLETEELVQKGQTKLLLETTAGQGTSVGHKFEHIGAIIERVKGKIPIGVCIDTCHIFVAGYDIRTEEGWAKTLREFDDKIGLQYLMAFHVNDSAKDFGSRVDRHADIGQGKIGWESFRYLMQNTEVPKYLETPSGPPSWKNEIITLRKYAEEKN